NWLARCPQVRSRLRSSASCVGSGSECPLEHRPDDSLEREEDQYHREDHERELEHLPDEAQVPPILAVEIEERRHSDRGKREKQQQADENHGARGGGSTACPCRRKRPLDDHAA